jgi:single-strand DNA-binding protein
MSQVGYVTLTGYVTAEPKMWLTARTQTPVASVRVGSTPRRLNRGTGEWQDGETSYYTVKCWRKLAENVHGSLRKGDMIIVRGKISTRTWVDDQQRTRTEMQVEADSMGHDLSFGWSRLNRGVWVPPGSRRGIDEGEAARQGMSPDADPAQDADSAQYADSAQDADLADGAPFSDEFDEEMPDLSRDGGNDDGNEGLAARLAPGDPDVPPVGELAEAAMPL